MPSADIDSADPGLLFRRARPSDLDAIWALLARISVFETGHASRQECFSIFDSSPYTFGVVGVYHETVLAYGELVLLPQIRGGTVGSIQNVVVAEDGKRWGTALVEQLLSIATTQGCYKCVLEADDGVAGFYRTLGFKRRANSLVRYATADRGREL